MSATLYGVGVGPGDPELITLKAARLIGSADVVAYHSGAGKQSNARRIAADLIPSGVTEEELVYPVTTQKTDHPGGYAGAMADFYAECTSRLWGHLEAGRDVVVLAEGDPMFYGSFMYLYDRLAADFPTEVVAGVPAFAAATAGTALPLVRQTDALTVLPGTLSEPELSRRLADTDGAVIMKLGRTFRHVRSALEQAGRLAGSWYVERASTDVERVLPVADVDPDEVPYFSVVLVPGDAKQGVARYDRVVETVTAPSEQPAEVVVVGLGPGQDEWCSSEVTQVLEEVDHVVGYGPYVARVPQRPGLVRHSSGNTVEVDRARQALELALSGEKVAVVSGGDAGIFGMASAVFEAAEDSRYTGVSIRVVPAISAVQAVAARAGAPIGADFAVLSLSDRLKPWSVVEQRLRAVAESDLVLALYNPRSRARTEQLAQARAVLLEHKSPETVVIVGRDVGRAEESVTVTTLEALETTEIDMKCLLIVGASTTRVTASGRVWSPRFVD